MKRAYALLFAMAFASAAIAQATPPALTDLLDLLGMPYVEVQDGVYKVIVELEGETTSLIAYETAAFGNEEDPNFKMISLFTIAVDAPEGFRHPQAMLKQIAEVNDNILVGKVSIGSNGSIYYNSAFFTRNADDTSLALELLIAHQMRMELKEMLSPYIEEG